MPIPRVSECRVQYPSLRIMQYEDLVAEPRRRFRALYHQLDLSWSSKIGNTIENRTRGDGGGRIVLPHRRLITFAGPRGTCGRSFMKRRRGVWRAKGN